MLEPRDNLGTGAVALPGRNIFAPPAATNIRGSSGRHLHVRWDLLVDLIGAKELIELVRALPDPESWNRPLTADEEEILKQARECAVDPEAASQRMEELRSQYS
jgi:hypothetical protein